MPIARLGAVRGGNRPAVLGGKGAPRAAPLRPFSVRKTRPPPPTTPSGVDDGREAVAAKQGGRGSRFEPPKHLKGLLRTAPAGASINAKSPVETRSPDGGKTVVY